MTFGRTLEGVQYAKPARFADLYVTARFCGFWRRKTITQGIGGGEKIPF